MTSSRAATEIHPRLAVGTHWTDEQSSEHAIEEDRVMASRPTGKHFGWGGTIDSGYIMNNRLNV